MNKQTKPHARKVSTDPNQTVTAYKTTPIREKPAAHSSTTREAGPSVHSHTSKSSAYELPLSERVKPGTKIPFFVDPDAMRASPHSSTSRADDIRERFEDQRKKSRRGSGR